MTTREVIVMQIQKQIKLVKTNEQSPTFLFDFYLSYLSQIFKSYGLRGH